MKNFLRKIKRFFTKYKLYNTRKYYLIEKGTTIFRLSEYEKDQADTVKNNIQYRFTPTGIGNIVEVVDLKTNEVYNITDYASW